MRCACRNCCYIRPQLHITLTKLIKPNRSYGSVLFQANGVQVARRNRFHIHPRINTLNCIGANCDCSVLFDAGGIIVACRNRYHVPPRLHVALPIFITSDCNHSAICF